MRRRSTSLIIEKCRSKLQWGTTSHQSEWPSLKSLQTIHAGEGVERREPVILLTGMWISPATVETSMEVSLKTVQNRITVRPKNPTPGHISGENHNSERKWQPIPVFSPGKSRGQRSLGGYSSWGCKELDTSERTHMQKDTCTSMFIEALFTIAKTGKQSKCPSTDEGIKKCGTHIYWNTTQP